MPVTRNGTQGTIPGHQHHDRAGSSPPQSLKVTRSGQVVNQLDAHGDNHDDRPAKRRRVELSNSGSLEVSHRSEAIEASGSTDDPSALNTDEPQGSENEELLPTSAIKRPPGPGSTSNSNRSKPTKTVSRMKVESLPILDNLANQLLSTLSKSSYQDIAVLISQSQSEASQDFCAVRSLFEHTKQVYLRSTPFLSPVELDLPESSQVDILRKANFATFFLSVFTGDIGLDNLDAYFLDIFVPENGRLLKAQGSMLLELKTQAFIAAATTSSQSASELLSQLFPGGLETTFMRKRPGSRTLVPSEQDFIKRLTSRRDILRSDIDSNENALSALPNRYKWEDFLREVAFYLNKNFELLCPGSSRGKVEGGRSVPTQSTPALQQGEMEGQFSINAEPLPLSVPEPLVAPAQAAPEPTPAQLPMPMPEPAPLEMRRDDFVAKAARAARAALEGQGQDYSYPSPYQLPAQQPSQYAPHTDPSPTLPPAQPSQPTFQIYSPPTAYSSASPHQHQSHESDTPGPSIPHTSQSAPTQILYERARRVATAKSTPIPSRKSSTPSQRRPWTTEEENALMAGLDRAKGPHWSQILAMFGPGGTINESLKDRNQVQLKDKARNLKLFFLKSGIEVPYYLTHVTGDLKTRAPAQASKQEAMERERARGLEDRAHYDGVQNILALAGGSNAGANFEQSQQTEGMTGTPPGMSDLTAIAEGGVGALDPDLA